MIAGEDDHSTDGFIILAAYDQDSLNVCTEALKACCNVQYNGELMFGEKEVPLKMSYQTDPEWVSCGLYMWHGLGCISLYEYLITGEYR